MDSEKSEDAIDLSHHLSALARNRTLSPLKGLYKYFERPGMISLAGGLPNPEYFPFDTLRADILVNNQFPVDDSAESQQTLSWFWNLFSASQSTEAIFIPKYADKSQGIDLARSLQYSPVKGLPQLSAVCREISNQIYKPAYANFTTLVHAGNTDGWAKTVITLCNPGDGVLCDEWTYPTALAVIQPYRISAIPVQMDVHGMRSDALRELLASWDPVSRGMTRPHIMYIVPVGQNPTGSTMKSARKKEVYDICVEYDIIIVEDDPYYFLQEGDYKPPFQRKEVAKIDDEQYIVNLVPTFLRFDYQGRVIRLDTFSKTIAPGCRLGWFTCNPLFAERIERAAETSTQAPSGFTQSFICGLMQKWQFDGYIRWLKGLSAQYTKRRDFFLDLLVKKFIIEIRDSSENSNSPTVYQAYLPNSQSKAPVFSFVPPTAGMFVWVKFSFDNHPAVHELGNKTLEDKLWFALAEAGVLVAPGIMFAADPSVGSSGNTGHFRFSFSYGEDEALRKGVDILADVIHNFYQKV